jgi:non-heme Fe2+,alpha-ketoglutarate-dependent halogenase
VHPGEERVGKLLTADQQARYREDGIVFPVGVLSPREAEEYRLACESLETQLGGRPRTIEVRQMHLHFPWAHRLATHPRVLDAVEDLLGPNLLVWASELFVKHPREASVSIGWHRDRPYMGLDPEHTVTAWIALTACHRENGCMRFVREEDRRSSPQWNGQSRPAADGRANREPQVPSEKMEAVNLAAGQMSLHDVYVLHGSGANESDEKRVGFALRFTTPECQPAAERPPAILARGRDRWGNFELHEPSCGEDQSIALEGMRRSARQHLEATLRNLQQPAR